jgi:flagellar protein FlaG
MNTVAMPTTTNVNPSAPTQPTGAIQQVRDDAANQAQNKSGVGQPGSGIGGTGITTSTQDSQRVTGADGKLQGRGKAEGKDQEPSKEEVEKAVTSVNDFINKLRHRELQFSLDDQSGKMVIKIVDTDNKKVIRQIPPEEMLRLADSVGQEKGWLVEQKA